MSDNSTPEEKSKRPIAPLPNRARNQSSASLSGSIPSSPASNQPFIFGAPPSQPGINNLTPPTNNPSSSNASSVPSSPFTFSFSAPTQSMSTNNPSKSAEQPANPSFSFASTDQASKPSFSFASTDQASKPPFSFASTDQASKPSFSFAPTEQVSKPSSSSPSTDQASKPLFSFASAEQVSKPSFSSPSTDQASKPSFSLASTDQASKPAFSFSSKEQTAKPAFSFSTEQTAKPAFSFSTEQTAKPSPSTSNTENLFSFSKPTTSAEPATKTAKEKESTSSSEPQKTASTGQDNTSELTNVPLAVRGNATEADKPSFSFGKPPQENLSSGSTPAKPLTSSTSNKRKNVDASDPRKKTSGAGDHQPSVNSPLVQSFKPGSPSSPDTPDSSNSPQITEKPKFDFSRLGNKAEEKEGSTTGDSVTGNPTFTLSTPSGSSGTLGKAKDMLNKTTKGKEPITISKTFNAPENSKPVDADEFRPSEEKSASKSSDIFGPPQSSAAAQTKIDVNITSPDKIETHTRYLHLPVDAQAELAELEAFLQGQKNICSTIGTRMDDYGDKGLSDVTETAKDLEKSASAMSYRCDRYRTAVERLQDDTDYNLRAARVSEDVLKDGSNSRVTGSMIQKQFYADLLTKCTTDLNEYKKRVDEMEEEIQNIKERGTQPPRQLKETIRIQHAIFISMAGKVSDLHYAVEKLKNLPSQRRQ